MQCQFTKWRISGLTWWSSKSLHTQTRVNGSLLHMHNEDLLSSVSRDPVNFWSWSRIILRKSRENKSLFTSAALITEWPNFLVNLHNSIILQQFCHSITVFNSSRSFSHFFIPGKYCESRNLMCVTCFICTVQHLPILWPSQHFYKSDRKTVSSSCIETVLGDGYNADVHMLHPNLT